MPYIGNDIQYGELNSQTFTGDGSTTAFTLNYTVSNVNSLLVTVADVIQEPTTAYTVSGTTLTFTSAPANSDTIHVRYLGRTLDVGTTAIVQDSDQDTKIQVEESADEDTIRFDTGGTERVTINSTSLTSNVNVSAPNLVTQNLIVNPEFRYDQEGFSGTTGVGASDDYIADQWRVITGGSASARWTFSIESAGGVSGTRPWAKFLNTTADGSPGASEAQIWEQPLEAQNIQSLLDSSGLGATVVSFDVFAHVDGASSITFPATIAVGLVTVDGTARQYIGDITITAADTWERVSLAIPADATASIDNNNGQGLSLRFGFYSGANQQATANTWENSTNCNITANTDNFADATNNYIGITAVKLEPGTVATPFVSEDYVVGLGRCQRFFFQDSEENTNSRTLGAGAAISATQALIHYEYPSTQRIKGSPVLAISAAGDFLLNVGNTPINVTALANFYGGSERSSTLIVTVASGLADKDAVLLKSDGTSAAKISYSSRF
jgi:hypothetical protein